MPSAAAKRRKAALKKKMKMVEEEGGVQVPGGDFEAFDAGGGLREGDDDLETQEERDTDSGGETRSPTSQDQHYPIDQGIEECKKGDLDSALIESLDNLVAAASGDVCDVELETKDEGDGKDCGETGDDAANGCRDPVGEVINELDETELLSVQRDLQDIPDEETSGDAYSGYPRSMHEGDTDVGVEKVYPGPEEMDFASPLDYDNRWFDDFSSLLESQDKYGEVATGDALGAHQSVLLPDGSVEIMNGTEKEDDLEEKIIDGEESRLAAETDNLKSLPNELSDPVNWLPEVTSLEAAPLASVTDPASLLQNDNVSGASLLDELDNSVSIMKEQKERFLSAIPAISGVDILNLAMNGAYYKLHPVGFDKMGMTEDGLESFSAHKHGEPMPSSGCVIAKVENGADKCNDATSANNVMESVLEENGAEKFENGSDTSNFAASGDVAVLKENGHGDATITGAVIPQNGHCQDKNDDLEDSRNNIDNQNELQRVPIVVRKSSWMGCCGLFDVITGSVR